MCKNKIKHKAIFLKGKWNEIKCCRSCKFYYDDCYGSCMLTNERMHYSCDTNKEICIDCDLPYYDLVCDHGRNEIPKNGDNVIIEIYDDSEDSDFITGYYCNDMWMKYSSELESIPKSNIISWRYIL